MHCHIKDAAAVLLFLVIPVWKYDVIRETKQGLVSGRALHVLGTTVEEYKCIPYAMPPTGELRFKPPLPAEPWKGIYEAILRGTACPQIVEYSFQIGGFTFTEDCLHLNVWTPASETQEQKRPVLVWIHGGGFTTGTASAEDCNGRYLAAKTGFVVVSINYRLGMLGFLNLGNEDASGNMGLLDQHMALKWVQENIAAFEGDPSLVTIFGHSAGSMSVHCHILSPASNNLFKRAIMMSGSMYTVDFSDTIAESIEKGNRVANLVRCLDHGKDLTSHPDEILNCLRSTPAEELVFASSEAVLPKCFTFFPSFGGDYLPYDPFAADLLLKQNDICQSSATTVKGDDVFEDTNAISHAQELGGLSEAASSETLRMHANIRAYSCCSEAGHGVVGPKYVRNIEILAGVTSDEGVLSLVFPPRPELLKDSLNDTERRTLKISLYGAVASWTKTEIPEMLKNYEFYGNAGDVNRLRKSYIDYLSDREFNCPMQFFCEKHSQKGNSVYRYLFGHVSERSKLPAWVGTPHAYEVPYFFGVPFADHEHFDEKDRSVSEQILRMVSSFARHG